MHQNSLTAFDEISSNGPAYEPSSKEIRRQAILAVYDKAPRPMRDYDVLQKLFPGSSDMNLSRPRISELIKDKILVECGKGKSHSGNRPVRLVKLATQKFEQLTLL